MNWRRTIGLLLIGAGLAVLTLKLTRVYDPTPAVGRWSAKASPRIAQTMQRLHPERVVRGVLIFLPVCVGAILLFTSSKGKGKVEETAAPAALPSKVSGKPLKAGKVAIDFCNVLQKSMA